MTMRTCLDCGVLTQGRRCVWCRRKREAMRNADPKRAAYRDPVYRAIPLVGACVDCGSRSDLTRDHVLPLRMGGTNASGNIVLRCRSCNSRKH